MEEVTAKNSELQHIEEEHELLKAAVDMAFDDQHPVHFYIEQLNAEVDAKRHNLVELELQWYDIYVLFIFIMIESYCILDIILIKS